jgi:nicotinamidase-related amidase
MPQAVPPFLFVDLDLQEDLFSEEAPLKLVNRELALKAILETARELGRLGLPLLSGLDAHEADDPEFGAGLRLHCLKDTPGARRISALWKRAVPVIPSTGKRQPWPDMSEIRTRGGGLILEKRALDLFSNVALREILRNWEVRELILFGALLEHDVLATALSARTLGYEVTVLNDACGYLDAAAAEASRAELRRRGSKVEYVPEVLGRVGLWKRRMERPVPAATGAGKNKTETKR